MSVRYHSRCRRSDSAAASSIGRQSRPSCTSALGGAVLDSTTGAEVYLSKEPASRLAALAPHEWEALRTSIEQLDGVARAWRTTDLRAGRDEAASDRLALAARQSAFPGRSGDIILLTDPYWFTYRIVATHGTPYAYDQHVPLVFLGRTSSRAATPRPPVRPTSRRHWHD